MELSEFMDKAIRKELLEDELAGYIITPSDMTLKPEDINQLISANKVDTNKISDGYHTFGELYEHRIQLFIKLCEFMADATPPDCEGYGCKYNEEFRPWKSKLHNDGSSYEGWFILGIGKKDGKQITYHLPVSKWDECYFAETLDTAPPWDGHTPNAVLERLRQL